MDIPIDIMLQMVRQPIVPAEFTQDEIKEAMLYSAKKIIEINPKMRNKAFRSSLSGISKIEILNLMTDFYDDAVYMITRRKEN